MSPENTDSVRQWKAFGTFLAGFYGLWLIRVLFLLPVDGRIHSEWLRQGWCLGLRLLVWVLPVFLYLKRTGGPPALSVLGLDVLPRGKALYRGLAIMAAFLILSAAVAMGIQGGSLEGAKSMTAPRWAGLFVGMSIVAFAEEVLFRGFVFRWLRSNLSFHTAGLLSSGLFVLIHWPGWLYMQGLNAHLVSLNFSVFLVGYVLALLLEVTQSLWPPILLHLLNNVLSASLL